MNRRTMLTTTALIAPALAVAACGTLPATTRATVEQIIAVAQAWMPFVSGAVAIGAAFVPGAVAFLPEIQGGLSAVAAALANMSSTMTASVAQPIANQIAIAMTNTMTSVKGFVAAMPQTQQNAVANIMTEANQAVTAFSTLLTTLVPSATVPTAAMGPVVFPPRLYIRSVK
jgi:hypothetical protein